MLLKNGMILPSNREFQKILNKREENLRFRMEKALTQIEKNIAKLSLIH